MPAAAAPPIQLTREECAQLDQLVRSPSTPQAIARRARIIRHAARGESNAAIARRVGVSRSAVARWRTRFLEAGLRGLEDEPRSGAPRQIPANILARILRMSLSGRASNSTRAIALSTGVSQSTVCRVRRQFGIRPGTPGAGDPAVLALFGPCPPCVTGFSGTTTQAVVTVEGRATNAHVLIVCGDDPDRDAELPAPLLRPGTGSDPWAVLHQWLAFFAEFGALCRDSRVTDHEFAPLARPA